MTVAEEPTETVVGVSTTSEWVKGVKATSSSAKPAFTHRSTDPMPSNLSFCFTASVAVMVTVEPPASTTHWKSLLSKTDLSAAGSPATAFAVLYLSPQSLCMALAMS